jgi:hypothetical protein
MSVENKPCLSESIEKFLENAQLSQAELSQKFLQRMQQIIEEQKSHTKSKQI